MIFEPLCGEGAKKVNFKEGDKFSPYLRPFSPMLNTQLTREADPYRGNISNSVYLVTFGQLSLMHGRLCPFMRYYVFPAATVYRNFPALRHFSDNVCRIYGTACFPYFHIRSRQRCRRGRRFRMRIKDASSFCVRFLFIFANRIHVML